MTSIDFDRNIQEVFNKNLLDFKPVKWRDWLKISSREEYENLAIKLSGLDKVDNLFDRINKENTNSRSFSIDIKSYLNSYDFVEPQIFCHTSGTTNGDIGQLKWYHMTRELIKRLWAPGMQAIFQSSGLDSKSSAIIFVPSRMNFDGINQINEEKYIALYSSEFSQRVMISVLKPKSYLFDEYKNATDIDILSKILNLEDIAVISAPAITILKWADPQKLQEGLKLSFNKKNKELNPDSSKLFNLIKKEGVISASKKIYALLADKFSTTTIIFSISSLTQANWELIRKFLKWEKGKERFTNLYVASEIGPFAASITLGKSEDSHPNEMHIFPLTLPIIEKNGEKALISRSNNKIGKLFVSRFDNKQVLINIDIGDVVYIKNQDTLPVIDGKILRAGFNLKYPINISKKVKLPLHFKLSVGDYFPFKTFEIIEPRNLLHCLNRYCNTNSDSMLLIQTSNNFDKGQPWNLALHLIEDSKCGSLDEFLDTISKCPEEQWIQNAVKKKHIKIELLDEPPIDFVKTRTEMLFKVRAGKIPKGILKKWPLYVVSPSS